MAIASSQGWLKWNLVPKRHSSLSAKPRRRNVLLTTLQRKPLPVSDLERFALHPPFPRFLNQTSQSGCGMKIARRSYPSTP